MVRFHANYSNNKVEVADLSDPPGLPGPPRQGKCKSDGRGTYRRQTTGNYTTVIRSAQQAHSLARQLYDRHCLTQPRGTSVVFGVMTQPRTSTVVAVAA